MQHVAATESSVPPRRTCLTVFLVALVIRLAWLGLVASSHSAAEVVRLFPDSIRYDALARWMLGDEWRYPPGVRMLPNDPLYVSGEGALLYSAPGYPVFIAGIYAALGRAPWSVLLVQAILSAAGCTLTANLAWQLFASRRIALLAGLLASFSLTSATLAAAFATECLFYTLFVAALVSGLAALRRPRAMLFLLHGLALAAAALVKPVLQFWPPLMLLVCLMLWGWPPLKNRRAAMIGLMLSMLLPIAALGGWAWRNHERHRIFTVAEMGSSSMRWMWTARAMAVLDPARDIQSIQRTWRESLIASLAGNSPSFRDAHADDRSVVAEMLRDQPSAMAQAYAASVAQDALAPDDLHNAQAPRLAPLWRVVDPILRRVVAPLIVTLSAIALVMLGARKQWGACILLAGIYLYFAALSGVAYWQGSRYFYPADVVVWIVLAWSVTMVRRRAACDQGRALPARR